MEKICSRCLIKKDVCEFHKHKGTNDGYYTICKECRKPISKKYSEENKESISTYRTKKYYENHEENLLKERERIKNEREVRLNRTKIYYEKNKDKVNEYQKKHYQLNKEKYIKKAKDWRDNNKERSSKSISERKKIRKKEDILFRLQIKLKTDIYNSLKRQKRSKKLELIIGLSLEDYKKYIESQFEEWMSWDNWGLHTWHIDHIIPLCSAKTEEEVYELWHYTNLRPLSAIENLKKGKKF
jgi:hypothetical protein